MLHKAMSVCGATSARLSTMPAKRIVYLIQSETTPSQHHVGLTANLLTRLAQHNAGEGRHTQKTEVLS